MAETWFTHNVEDNRGRALDFALAELERAGLVVRPDARNLRADPFWRQAGAFLLNPRRVGAWCIYVTDHTLSDAVSRGQILEAVEKVTGLRRDDLLIALVCPASLNAAPFPPRLSTLTAVHMSDQYWAERLRAAVERRRPEIPPPGMPPYVLTLHQRGCGEEQQQALEIRPRLGSWAPFVAGVPLREKDSVRPRLLCGPRGRLPPNEQQGRVAESASEDGLWWLLKADAPADRLNSYYLCHERMPETVLFGAAGGHAVYTMRLRPVMGRYPR